MSKSYTEILTVFEIVYDSTNFNSLKAFSLIIDNIFEPFITRMCPWGTKIY